MSIQELETEVKSLSPTDLAAFSKWFQKFAANSTDDGARSAWTEMSVEGLARAYSESEPEYSVSDVKRQ